MDYQQEYPEGEKNVIFPLPRDMEDQILSLVNYEEIPESFCPSSYSNTYVAAMIYQHQVYLVIPNIAYDSHTCLMLVVMGFLITKIIIHVQELNKTMGWNRSLLCN